MAGFRLSGEWLKTHFQVKLCSAEVSQTRQMYILDNSTPGGLQKPLLMKCHDSCVSIVWSINGHGPSPCSNFVFATFSWPVPLVLIKHWLGAHGPL